MSSRFYLALAFLCLVACQNESGNTQDSFATRTCSSNDEYSFKFKDKKLALDILNALDEPDSYSSSYQSSPHDIEKENKYCQKHRQLFIEDTSSFFTEKKFISTYHAFSFINKEGIPLVDGKNLHPEGYKKLQRKHKRNRCDLKPDNHAFIFLTTQMIKFAQNVLCLTQMYNHIHGNHAIAHKGLISAALAEYQKQYELRPQCLNEDQFFLKTVALTDTAACEKFFAHLESLEYQELKQQRKIVYFRKSVEIHSGRGVFLVDDAEEERLKAQYGNGTFCGAVLEKNLIQEHVFNPLLINGKKADLRAFMLIASTNPLIVYYNDGYARTSLLEFELEGGLKEAFLTNNEVALGYLKELQKQGVVENRTASDLWNETVFTFEELQSSLLERELISDPNWLDNYLRPEIQRLLVHLVRASQEPFRKHSSLFEMIRVDLIMDTNFKLWFLEANQNLNLNEVAGKAGEIVKKFFVDTFEVLFGLMRSRAKRTIQFVNVLITSRENYLEDKEMLDQAKSQFQELTKNYFEPDFTPIPTGKFVKIIDENESGAARYSGLLQPDCF